MEFSNIQNKEQLLSIKSKYNWELVHFKELLSDETRNAVKIKKEDYLKIGKFPIIDQGKELISGYTNDEEKIYKDKLPVILFGDHTRVVKYVDFPFYLGADGVKLLTPKKEINVKYLYYFIKTVDIPDTGYNRHFKFLKNIIIPLPPIETQKKIADVLDKAQELIDKRKEQIEKLDEFIQSVFLDMFGDPIRNSKNWVKDDFGNYIEVLTDYHANGSYKILKQNVELLDEENYALMIRTTDLENNNFTKNVKYITKEAYEFLSKTKVYGGEIIINKIGSAGNVYLMPKLNRPVSLGMNLFMIRLSKKLNNVFIYHLFNNSTGKSLIMSKVRGAVTKTITKDAIRQINIPIPPIELQNKFAEIVEKAEKQKELLQKSLTEMENNFNNLMQKAFKGELF
ncbi:restriction endonuclease subunit S [Caloranaerobacter sp. DY30410]|uniref:restriction endonuclease subunit S n=1 Tax=Caloranaerobacter sp. DY30410 TaxID=3238305 RepID=UPI003CFF5575